LPAATGTKVGPAGGQSVDLVKEQDTRGVLPCLLEESVQVPFAIADPHLEHVVDPDGEKPRADLAGRRAGQVSLAATGRTIEQDPAADRLPVGAVELGMIQRMNDLHPDLILERIHTANVGKGEIRPLDLG